MTLSIICAMDRNRLIGSNNSLPWHIPADLKFFKEMTTYTNVVMGRKTFESIGKPLPNRNNIILTSDLNINVHGCLIYHSIEDVIRHSEIDFTHSTYIIGGSSIYEQFIPHADYMYITHIDAEFAGDSYFPDYNTLEWKCINEEYVSKDKDTDYDLTIRSYKRFNK